MPMSSGVVYKRLCPGVLAGGDQQWGVLRRKTGANLKDITNINMLAWLKYLLVLTSLTIDVFVSLKCYIYGREIASSVYVFFSVH